MVRIQTGIPSGNFPESRIHGVRRQPVRLFPVLRVRPPGQSGEHTTFIGIACDEGRPQGSETPCKVFLHLPRKGGARMLQRSDKVSDALASLRAGTGAFRMHRFVQQGLEFRDHAHPPAFRPPPPAASTRGDMQPCEITYPDHRNTNRRSDQSTIICKIVNNPINYIV